MENPEFIKVRASLVRASYSDVIYQQGKLLENRMFFICDQLTKKFIDTMTIHSSDQWDKDLFNYGVKNQMIYKLSNSINSLDFQFQLILKKATDFEIFYCPKWLKINTIYYLMDKSLMVTGPFNITENDDPKYFKTLIENGYLYTPSKRQLFEPFHSQKSA